MRYSQSIAVLGTGIIGAAVARNLAVKGFKVRAWNRTSEKAQALAVDDVEPVAEVVDAVTEADMVITVLKDGPAVDEAMKAALPALRREVIWLQLGTVGIETVDALATFARKNGIIFFDAPVQGTRQPAEQGKLVILASGPNKGRDVVQSVFDAIGQRTVWVANEPGASSRLKLALNSFVFALTNGTAEALLIAKTLGVDPALVLETISGGPLDSGYFQTKGTAMLKGDFKTSFSVDNGVKDARLVVDAIAATGVCADVAKAGLVRFERTATAEYGGKDIAATFLA